MPHDVPALIARKNELYGEAFLMLLEINYSDSEVLRWLARDERTNDPVVFEGNTYTPWAFGIPTRSQYSHGQIPMFDIPVANPERVLQSLLQHYVIEGKSGRLITTHREHIDDSSAKIEEWFTIVSADSHATVITLTCSGIRYNPRLGRIPSATMSREEYPGLQPQNRPRVRY